MIVAFAESSRAAIVSEVKFPAFVLFQMNGVAQQLNPPAAVANVKSRPPDEILQRSRLAALEIFARQMHQGLVPVGLTMSRHLVGR